MSAQSANTAPDLLNLEIDGKPTQIRKGAMIIEAADAIGIAIPRFCYHRKLPIAANCRMCLVDVEMGGRPMPKPAAAWAWAFRPFPLPPGTCGSWQRWEACGGSRSGEC